MAEQCQCYKSKKESTIQCPRAALKGSKYCGYHQNCGVVFSEGLSKPLLNMEHTMMALNFLGPLYHSGQGLKYEAYSVNKDNIDMLQDMVENGYASVYDYHDRKMFEVTDNNFRDISHIIYDLEFLRAIAQQRIEFKEVTIKFAHNEWRIYPEMWDNREGNELPPLSTRNYIEVIDPFMNIRVSAEEKGQPLTIDDILFATRGLMADETRVVDEGYQLLRYDLDHLVIEPIVDNWST